MCYHLYCPIPSYSFWIAKQERPFFNDSKRTIAYILIEIFSPSTFRSLTAPIFYFSFSYPFSYIFKTKQNWFSGLLLCLAMPMLGFCSKLEKAFLSEKRVVHLQILLSRLLLGKICLNNEPS